MDSVSRLAAEMAQRLEHGTRYRDSFSRHTIIYCGRKKLPATMSEPNSTLRVPLHRLVVYNFRYHYHIHCTYTTNVFHSHRKQKKGD